MSLYKRNWFRPCVTTLVIVALICTLLNGVGRAEAFPFYSPPNFSRRATLIVSPTSLSDSSLVDTLNTLDTQDAAANHIAVSEMFEVATAEMVEQYSNLTSKLNGTLLGVYRVEQDARVSTRSPHALCPAPDAEEKEEEEGFCHVIRPGPHGPHRKPHHHGKPHRPKKSEKIEEEEEEEETLSEEQHAGMPPVMHGHFTKETKDLSERLQRKMANLPPIMHGHFISNKKAVNEVDVKVNDDDDEEEKEEEESKSKSKHHSKRHGKKKPHHGPKRGPEVILHILQQEAHLARRIAHEQNTTVEVPVVRVAPPPHPPHPKAEKQHTKELEQGFLASLSDPNISVPVVIELWNIARPERSSNHSHIEPRPADEPPVPHPHAHHHHGGRFSLVRVRATEDLPFPPHPRGGRCEMFSDITMDIIGTCSLAFAAFTSLLLAAVYITRRHHHQQQMAEEAKPLELEEEEVESLKLVP